MSDAQLSGVHTVRPSAGPGMTAENPYCVRYAVDGRMVARQGAMVAYRGDLRLQVKGQGIKKLLKRSVTGEGVALMEVEGRGDIWLADLARNVIVLEDGGGLSISGKSVLCFDDSLAYEIRRVKGAGMAGGGLFNCVFAGRGALAVTADGEPFVIPVEAGAPVRVDTDAVVGWSAGLETAVRRSESARSLLKGGSGEAFQLELSGDGFVIVQPSEGPVEPESGGGGGGLVDELLGG